MTLTQRFPESFLWGTATSAHQVEGNNCHSDYWYLEQLDGGGFTEPSGLACDHYRRYADDIQLIADLGLNSYRFSIEWARIEPEKGQFCQQALDHYLDMAKTCRRLGLTVIVTFHHFSSPLWFSKEGGWENPKSIDYFIRYCQVVTKHLSDWLDYVCTINEPNLSLMLSNIQPELRQHFNNAQKVGAKATNSAAFSAIIFGDPQRQTRNMLKAHPLAVKAIKTIAPQLKVGWTVLIQDHQYTPAGKENRDELCQLIYLPFLDATTGDDFVGVQNYSRVLHDESGVIPPASGSELTLMGYEFYPQGLTGALRFVHQHCQLPIFITENGVAVSDDKRRESFIIQALTAVNGCINEGIEVLGYLYWSLFDNFEYSLGFEPTFGLVAVDRTTQQRTTKPSAYLLGKIARENQLK